MSLRTSATRYAKALFDVGVQEKADLAKFGADLSAISQVLSEHAELRLATERAGVTDAARIAVMDRVSDAVGVTPQVKKLVALLTRTRKLALVKDLSETYNERLLAHQNIVRADVTSAGWQSLRVDRSGAGTDADVAAVDHRDSILHARCCR